MTKLLKSRLQFTSVNDEFPGASPGLLLYIEYKYETLRIFFKDNTVDVSQTRKSYLFSRFGKSTTAVTQGSLTIQNVSCCFYVVLVKGN